MQHLTELIELYAYRKDYFLAFNNMVCTVTYFGHEKPLASPTAI